MRTGYVNVPSGPAGGGRVTVGPGDHALARQGRLNEVTSNQG